MVRWIRTTTKTTPGSSSESSASALGSDKRNGRNFGFTIVLNIWRMDRYKENLSGLWARKAWNILKSGGIHSVDSSKHQLKENLTCFSNIFLKFGSLVFCLIIVCIYICIFYESSRYNVVKNRVEKEKLQNNNNNVGTLFSQGWLLRS